MVPPHTISAVVGWIAVPEGRVFFYANRLWLDRLSGLGALIKKKLGQRMLSSQMLETVERAGVCKPTP
jgi:hypothetical protein